MTSSQNLLDYQQKDTGKLLISGGVQVFKGTYVTHFSLKAIPKRTKVRACGFAQLRARGTKLPKFSY